MDRNRWIIFITAIVIVIATLLFIGRNNRIDVSNIEQSQIQTGEYADHVKGNPDAKITIIEYADFECPACGQSYATVDQISEKYGDSIRFVFRHFPLTSIHPNALSASAAAEAASKQGKFWEMYDLLYQNQSQWSSQSGTDSNERKEIFLGYAKQIGLDEDQFTSDVNSDPVRMKIRFDRALGQKSKVDATPTFFLNGERVDNATSTDLVQGEGQKLSQQIEELIKKQQETTTN